MKYHLLKIASIFILFLRLIFFLPYDRLPSLSRFPFEICREVGSGGLVLYLASSFLVMLHSINAFCDKIFKKFTNSEMKDLELCCPCPEFKQNMFLDGLHFYWPRINACRV